MIELPILEAIFGIRLANASLHRRVRLEPEWNPTLVNTMCVCGRSLSHTGILILSLKNLHRNPSPVYAEACSRVRETNKWHRASLKKCNYWTALNRSPVCREDIRNKFSRTANQYSGVTFCSIFFHKKVMLFMAPVYGEDFGRHCCERLPCILVLDLDVYHAMM